MRDPLERVAEEKTVERAKEHGYLVRKISFIGVRGAPDRVFGRYTTTTLIEFKRKGKTPTRQQLKRHNELREAFGWEVFWADSYEQACYYLGIKP